MFHFWFINNNVTGGPDRPEELAKIPLKEPATIVAIFSLLIVIVLPDIKKNAVMSINVDIINLRTYVEITYNVTIPMTKDRVFVINCEYVVSNLVLDNKVSNTVN